MQQTTRSATGAKPDMDIPAIDRKVDLVSAWLFRRIPLGILAFVSVYIALRFADTSGREQWRVESPKDKSFQTLTTSPAGIHALRTDGVCQTFDALTGSMLWETSLCDKMEYDASLKASNDLLLVTSMDGLWVLDTSKGTVLHKQEDSPRKKECTLILDRRLLVADNPNERLSWRQWRGKDTTNYQERATAGNDNPSLSCVDFASGRVTWVKPFKGRHITALAGEGALFVCSSEVPQSWEWKPCAKHTNMRMLYGQECPSCVSRYIPASDRKIEAMDTATGLTRWRCQLEGGEVRNIEIRSGNLMVFTKQRVYTVDSDGREIGRMSWGSSNLTETIVTATRLLGVGTHGGIQAASAAPPAPAWNHGTHGYLRDVTSDDSTIYVSTVEEDVAQNRQSEPAPGAQTQMTREFFGDEDGDSSGGGSSRRVLTSLDVSDGHTKWRREDLSGRIVPDGDMFLRITEGYETALIFPDGGTVIYAHLARNGRQVWSAKIPFAMRNMTLLPDRIVALVEKRGSGMFGSGKAEFSAVAAFNRRSLLNRIMRP